MSLDIPLILGSTLVLFLYVAAVELSSLQGYIKTIIYGATCLACGISSPYWYYPTCGLASALFFISPLSYSAFTMKDSTHGLMCGAATRIVLAFLSIASFLGYCIIIADFILNYEEIQE